MKFELTSDEAQLPARAVIKHLKKRKMKIAIEKAAWPDAPYRTTIAAEKDGLKLLVEAQGVLSYGRSLNELATWMTVNRHYAELYVATTSEATLGVGLLHNMKKDGIGLFIVDENGSVTEHQRSRNPALVVTPDPTLKLGPSKTEVSVAVDKFNTTNRKDGLRDMCEIVERLTAELGIAACRKGRLKIPEQPFEDKDWSGQINELSRPEAFNHPYGPLFSANLKTDLQSFRGSRNLFDHKVKSAIEEKKRQMQFAERMMQGPRLAAELISLKRKVSK